METAVFHILIDGKQGDDLLMFTCCVVSSDPTSAIEVALAHVVADEELEYAAPSRICEIDDPPDRADDTWWFDEARNAYFNTVVNACPWEDGGVILPLGVVPFETDDVEDAVDPDDIEEGYDVDRVDGLWRGVGVVSGHRLAETFYELVDRFAPDAIELRVFSGWDGAEETDVLVRDFADAVALSAWLRDNEGVWLPNGFVATSVYVRESESVLRSKGKLEFEHEPNSRVTGELWEVVLWLVSDVYVVLTVWADSVATFVVRESTRKRLHKVLLRVDEFPLLAPPARVFDAFKDSAASLYCLSTPPLGTEADNLLLDEIRTCWLGLSRAQLH